MSNNISDKTKESWYWKNRILLFSKFDEGIQIDEEGLYSVRIEDLGLNLSKKIDSKVILDCFGCVGGSAIGFARTGKKVISVELDESRHNMAKNNAKIYGVQDKITFINGSIFDVLPTLDFDAVYMDPPWGGVDYIDKENFLFDDFLVDCKKLINLVLEKTDNIIFSFPVNFDFRELKKLEFDFHIEPVFLGTTKLYYDVFFNKNKNNFLKYKDIVVNTMYPYLYDSLRKTPYNKHLTSKEMFSSHMSIITEFLVDNLVNIELSTNTIKGLHKMLYPSGYKGTMEIPGKGKVEYLIPGEYKILPNVGIDRNNDNDFLYIEPKDVKLEMDELVENFNSKINSIENKEDFILDFFCRFSYIHPFADGNGRVGFILSDILGLKYLGKILGLSKLKEIDKLSFYKAIKYFDEHKDLTKIKELITENSDFLNNQNNLSYDIISASFETYLNFTNEKELLIKSIGEKFKKIDKKIIFSDIGAGSGIVAKKILEKYNDKIEIYNFLEPSMEFVGNFASRSRFNNIVYLNNKIENYDEIGTSDFIMCVHSSQYIQGLKENIKKLYDSLNKGGILLFVNWDKESCDYKIKKQLYGEMFDISKNIENILIDLNIKYEKEKINTMVFGVGNIEKLDKNSRNICSFFMHKKFEDIDKYELDSFINIVKKYRKGDILENIENYFWIEKI